MRLEKRVFVNDAFHAAVEQLEEVVDWHRANKTADTKTLFIL